MTTTDAIVVFLLARYAEERQVAEYAMSRGDTGELVYDGQWFGAVSHAQRWTPARVLADLEAKRRIVEEWGPFETYNGEDLLRVLAAAYADHPDYDQDWRP